MSPAIQEAANKLLSYPTREPYPHETAAGRERIRRRNMLHAFQKDVGPRLADSRLDNFVCDHPQQTEVVRALRDYAENMPDEHRAGNGVVLYGPSGSGKDHLLIGLARVAMLGGGWCVRWVFGVDLYSELRDRMDSEDSEEAWVQRLAGPSILILSDPIPPRGALTDFQTAMLQRVVNRRYNACKPTWVTLNVQSSQEADDRMGAAIVDRLKDGAVTAFCKWPSYRKARPVRVIS